MACALKKNEVEKWKVREASRQGRENKDIGAPINTANLRYEYRRQVTLVGQKNGEV